MSITNRLSLFFLTALAVVLVGFSLTLYVLAHRHLYAQTDHRLDAALHTLVAAIEVHPGDVEWEPLERRMMIGEDPAPDQVRWAVHDLHGRLIDCSRNLEHHEARESTGIQRGWTVRVQRVRAGKFESEPVEGKLEQIPGELSQSFDGAQLPGSVDLPNDRTYQGDGLILTAAISNDPVLASLRQLGWTLLGVSAVIWLSAAVWGRWLCRRALRPVYQMASSAREIRQHLSSGEFLEVAPTGDELEDLGTAFNDLLAGLREALERQSRFTGDASHQLRTPLTAMLGQIDVALRQDRTVAEYQRVLTVLRRRGDQLHQIIESLLFLARADVRAPLPDMRSFDLGEWCRGWMASWEQHPRVADLRVDVRDTVVVHTQPALLGQILDNLIDNACKYSEPGTPVVVSVSVEADAAILTVTDRGCGISPAEAALIFQPFYRGEQARWHGKPGVGLGLTIVHRLAAMLGGTASVSSEIGQGSRFTMTLPVSRPEHGSTGEDGGTGQVACGQDEAA